MPPRRRLRQLAYHVSDAAPQPPSDTSALAGKRVLFCGFCQEVSTFNPVPSTREDFVHLRGREIVTGQCAGFGYIRGALPVLAAAGVTAVGTYDFTAAANGVLDHAEFMIMATELLESVRAAVADGIDGVFFHLHGAGQTSEDNDPEGYLLSEVRKIIGDCVPMVANFDLHGIITGKMMQCLNGLAVQHTYPHVDMPEVGEKAAKQLLALMADAKGAIAPKMLRVRVPALVRGDNMVTAPHENVGYVDTLMKRVIELEREPGVLAAALCWGNPFTDVPELLSQVLVLIDSNSPAQPEAKAQSIAESIAQDFWDGRAKMQATPGGDEKPFLPLHDAVATAQQAFDAGKGTVILTDAADATSSGASGNGASILAALVKQGYTGHALVPLVDPSAVSAAFSVGVGATLGGSAGPSVQLGGSFDGRFTLQGAPGFQGGPGSVPHAHEGPYQGVSAPHPSSLTLDQDCSATVTALSDGESIRQRWTWGSPGRSCTLQIGTVTVVIISNPVVLMTDDVFLGLGHDPKNYDAVVIKTPHAQPEMFDTWAFTNLGVDAPGATTADVSALGHTIARTPTQLLYPIDLGLAFQVKVETIEMAMAQTLAEAEAEATVTAF